MVEGAVIISMYLSTRGGHGMSIYTHGSVGYGGWYSGLYQSTLLLTSGMRGVMMMMMMVITVIMMLMTAMRPAIVCWSIKDPDSYKE